MCKARLCQELRLKHSNQQHSCPKFTEKDWSYRRRQWFQIIVYMFKTNNKRLCELYQNPNTSIYTHKSSVINCRTDMTWEKTDWSKQYTHVSKKLAQKYSSILHLLKRRCHIDHGTSWKENRNMHHNLLLNWLKDSASNYTWYCFENFLQLVDSVQGDIGLLSNLLGYKLSLRRPAVQRTRQVMIKPHHEHQNKNCDLKLFLMDYLNSTYLLRVKYHKKHVLT